MNNVGVFIIKKKKFPLIEQSNFDYEFLFIDEVLFEDYNHIINSYFYIH